MRVNEKRTDLVPTVVLSLKLFASTSSQNVLTIHDTGKATFQPGFGARDIKLSLDLDDRTVEDYLRAHLPVDSFLSLSEHYYEIPSQRENGTAANLYLRVGSREHWLGIGNYGRGDIPVELDANMTKAVLKLAEYITEG